MMAKRLPRRRQVTFTPGRFPILGSLLFLSILLGAANVAADDGLAARSDSTLPATYELWHGDLPIGPGGPDLRPDDPGWTTVPMGTFPVQHWTGIGWVKFRVSIAPQISEPMGLWIEQLGATEVYLDGRRIHQFGHVGATPATEVADRTQDPRPLFLPGAFGAESPLGEHEIAVRYSSQVLQRPVFRGLEPALAWGIGPLRPMVERRVELVRKLSVHQMLLVGISLAFAVSHLMLFLFQPKGGSNLFFALLAFSTGGAAFCNFQALISATPETYAVMESAFLVFLVAFALSALSFTHSLLSTRRPRSFYAFALAAAPLALWAPLRPFEAQPFILLFVLACNGEALRQVALAIWHRRQPAISGTGILAWGAVPLIVATPYQIAVVFGWVPELWSFLTFPTPYYGIIFLMISMSVYLARDFATTQDRLQRQIIRVQQMSMEAIGKERRNTG